MEHGNRKTLLYKAPTHESIQSTNIHGIELEVMNESDTDIGFARKL